MPEADAPEEAAVGADSDGEIEPDPILPGAVPCPPAEDDVERAPSDETDPEFWLCPREKIESEPNASTALAEAADATRPLGG